MNYMYEVKVEGIIILSYTTKLEKRYCKQNKLFIVLFKRYHSNFATTLPQTEYNKEFCF